jgi:hypothetical protein
MGNRFENRSKRENGNIDTFRIKKVTQNINDEGQFEMRISEIKKQSERNEQRSFWLFL